MGYRANLIGIILFCRLAVLAIGNPHLSLRRMDRAARRAALKQVDSVSPRRMASGRSARFGPPMISGFPVAPPR